MPAPPGETAVAPLSLKVQRSPCGHSSPLPFGPWGFRPLPHLHRGKTSSQTPGLSCCVSPTRPEQALFSSSKQQVGGKASFCAIMAMTWVPCSQSRRQLLPSTRNTQTASRRTVAQTTSAAMPGVCEDARVYLWTCLCSHPLQSRNKAELPLQYTASGAHMQDICYHGSCALSRSHFTLSGFI